jgi:hypothetical protein
MRTPVTLRADDGVHLADVGGLDARVAAALRRHGISSLFPVQVPYAHTRTHTYTQPTITVIFT